MKRPAFIEQFSSHPVAGDYIERKFGGVIFRATLEADCDNYGGYGIVISARTNNTILSEYICSSWQIEYHYLDTDSSYLHKIANGLLPEAVGSVWEILDELREVYRTYQDAIQ